ncbi:MAG: hypothetical protein JWN30_270 [Bacilli bacterium]|nr:hypothetical protein [Bacilli bacterium]
MSLPIRAGHIGKLECTSLLSIAGAANVFLSYPQQLVKYGSQASWMIPLFSTVIMLLIVFILRIVQPVLKNEDLLSISHRAAGKLITAVISSLAIVYFLLITSDELRQVSETVLTTMLTRSPISFVAIPLVMLICYFAHSGLEAISRTSWLVAPVLAILLVLLLIGMYNWVNVDYLQPWMGPGWSPLFIRGLLFTSAFPNVLVLIICAGSMRDQSHIAFAGLWSTVIIGVVYVVVELVCLTVFPAQLSVHLSFPVYQLARIINVGRFMERMDAIYIFLWVACAVTKMAVGLWASSYLTARMFGMPVYRPLIFSTAIVIYAIAFIPRSYPETLIWDATIFQRYGIVFTVGLPLLVLFFVLLKRGGKRREKKMHRTT